MFLQLITYFLFHSKCIQEIQDKDIPDLIIILSVWFL